MIDNNSTVNKNANVVVRDLAEGEGAVLLHLDSGEYYSVNPVGQAIWELLDGKRTVGEITTALRDLVEAPPDSLDADVVEFLGAVVQRDLVTVA